MKSHVNHILLGLCFVCVLLSSRAATVWNGPLITYTQPAPFPTNRDQLTPKVALTRASTSGMFNGVTETFYTHNFSPSNTLWAVGSLSDYATLTYTSWEAAGGGHPVLNLPGQQLVVHLIPEDIYLSLKFTFLGAHGVGGFSYERSTPPVPPPTITILSLSVGTDLVLTSTGATNWSVIPEFNTDLATANWSPLTVQTNHFLNGTNETACVRPSGNTIFVRIRSQPN